MQVDAAIALEDVGGGVKPMWGILAPAQRHGVPRLQQQGLHQRALRVEGAPAAQVVARVAEAGPELAVSKELLDQARRAPGGRRGHRSAGLASKATGLAHRRFTLH